MSLKVLVVNNKHRYLINEESPVAKRQSIVIINKHGWDSTFEFVKPTLEDVKPKKLKDLVK